MSWDQVLLAVGYKPL